MLEMEKEREEEEAKVSANERRKSRRLSLRPNATLLSSFKSKKPNT
jgi:hypothetical protein